MQADNLDVFLLPIRALGHTIRTVIRRKSVMKMVSQPTVKIAPENLKTLRATALMTQQ